MEEKVIITEEFRAEQKKEALRRMRTLKLHKNVVSEFRKEDKINVSERGGTLFWADDTVKKCVREWEEESGGLVYHVIKSYTSIGIMLTLMYVSCHTEEWEMDRKDLEYSGYSIAYVFNLSDRELSECGGVVVKPQIGGLVRVA